MTRPAAIRFRLSWLALAVVSGAILAFGIIITIARTVPSSPATYRRADGVALIGMGLFGFLITMIPYRRREAWAWYVLWYYPIFWAAHLIAGLPPGTDHVHQVVFIGVTLVSLLLAAREFVSRRRA